MRHGARQRERLMRALAIAELTKTSDRFDPDEAALLQKQMVGEVVVAITPGYDDARQGFLHNHESLPQMICLCEVPRDVFLALEFAKKHGLTPVCRSSGHSTAGYSANDELVIDVGRISYVVVDESSRTARVGAGTTFEKVDAVLGPLGLHLPGGGCPSVAVAGFMQGGGYSFTSRMFGMNCDNVIACTVLTADGQVRHVDGEHDADLFWALRGGTGNNFGVLLEVTYQLHELGELFGFGLTWPLETAADTAAAAEMLELFQREFTGLDSDPKLGAQLFVAQLARGDDAPMRPELLIRGMYRGDERECARALEPLIRLCPDDGRHDVWQVGTYEALNDHLMNHPSGLPDVPANIRAVVESRIVADVLSSDTWSTLLDFFTQQPPGTIMIAMESYGAAINDPAPTDTAFVHRRARMNLFVWSFWHYVDEGAQALARVDSFRDLVEPVSNGRAYQNYPNRSTPADRYPDLYWGENYPRLQRVKQMYDPESVFRFEQMVHPPTDE